MPRGFKPSAERWIVIPGRVGDNPTLRRRKRVSTPPQFQDKPKAEFPAQKAIPGLGQGDTLAV